METKVSIIIPVYNMSQYLSECLESVVNQTLKDIEIIAVNDGSTDNSLLILENYSSIYNNITIITQKNKGSGSARNTGIEHAKGKYLIFMDPDDYYPSNDCLESLYNAAEKNKVSMCGGVIVRNDGISRTEMDEKIVREFYRDKFFFVDEYPDIFCHQRFLFRTDMIKENKIYYPFYRRFQDPPFMLKAMICAGKIYGIDKVVYEYRVAHKQNKFSYEVCRDILCGIKDCFKLANSKNLKMICEGRLKNIQIDYIVPFYKYSFCGYEEIDEIINEINKLRNELDGNHENVILTAENVRQIRESSRREYDIMMSVLSNNDNKIIYGSGIKSHNLIEQYKDGMNNILGIAVTKIIEDSNMNEIAGLPVKQIEEYKLYNDNAWVIITTVAKYQDEIEQNLKRLGFQKIIKPDMRKIELAEAMKSD